MSIVRFVHFLGMSLWIGGMVAAMILAVHARRGTEQSRGNTLSLLGRLYSLVIGPGALLTVLTGLSMTMTLARRVGGEVMASASIWVMQMAGLVAGLLILFVGLPAATTLARLANSSDSDVAPLMARLQKRLSVVAHLVAVLVLVSLFFATVIR